MSTSTTSTASKTALALLGYGLVHSLLASRGAKASAARIFGERFRNAFYRPFFILQATVSFALLILYLARLPSRVLYRIQGPAAWILNGFRGSLVLYMVWAVREIGFTRILGFDGVRAWRGAEAAVPPEPEAQGPLAEAGGAGGEGAGMRVTGPFRLTRHPLNFFPVPILWLSPKMTDRSLAFAMAGTLYFWLGSKHEEARLRAAYGPAYEGYARSRIPFFFPGPG